MIAKTLSRLGIEASQVYQNELNKIKL